MMHQHLVLSALLAVVAAESDVVPWFCQGYDCPTFKADDKGAYEIRDYGVTTWVATWVESHRPDPSRSQNSHMFSRLYNYIVGDNVKRERMDMTVPVLTKTEKIGKTYNITMMFYLAEANPPAPTKSRVFLITRPAGRVFVRAFPSWWWPSNSYFRTELREMKKAIGDSKLYDESVYYKAAYNSPYDFFQRKQHEVWMDPRP